jgi:hypothetical protein
MKYNLLFWTLTNSFVIKLPLRWDLSSRIKLFSTTDDGFGGRSTVQSPEVSDAIAKLIELLSKNSEIDVSSPPSEEDITILENQFNELIKDMKKASVSDSEKSIRFTEAVLSLTKEKESAPSASLDAKFPQTKLYHESFAPYLCCTSSGPIGQKVKSFFKTLGSASDVKYVDSKTLLGLPDNELRYIARDVKTVIIACDDAPIPDAQSKPFNNWLQSIFSSNSDSKDSSYELTCSLDSNSLKRLLNAVAKEREKISDPPPAKIVLLVAGNNQKKSLASILSGDTFDLEKEVGF